MALRKYGEIWHIYYRNLDGKQTSISTGESSKKEAEKKERSWMAQVKSERLRKRSGSLRFAPTTTDQTVAMIAPSRCSPRLKLADAIDKIRKLYGEPSKHSRWYFERFRKSVPLKYMDEVTSTLAAEYLWDTYPDSGKSFNEAKVGCNVIFKKLLVYSGLTVSPFESIHNRLHRGGHQRKLSDDEIRKLISVADEPLRSAIFIAWHTGMRGTSVYAFRWDEIKIDTEFGGKFIQHRPPKTARFNRDVKIPVHPQLDEYLEKLPRSRDGRVLGFTKMAERRSFAQLCEYCEIKSTDEGIVRFGSIRKNFIQRCDAAGIRRTATRGMAGQTDDDITDIYSEDYAGALPIKELPGLFPSLAQMYVNI